MSFFRLNLLYESFYGSHSNIPFLSGSLGGVMISERHTNVYICLSPDLGSHASVITVASTMFPCYYPAPTVLDYGPIHVRRRLRRTPNDCITFDYREVSVDMETYCSKRSSAISALSTPILFHSLRAHRSFT